MNLSKKAFEKELDELLVSISNNIDEPKKDEFELKDLLSAAIGSQAAQDMLKVINKHNIAEGGDELPDVIKALKEAAQEKAAEKRERLLERAVAVGHARGDFDEYNDDELEEYVPKRVRLFEKLVNLLL